MLKSILLASVATIIVVASASAQLQPGPNIGPGGRSFVYSPRAAMPYGSTGNGCMGFGKQVVAMINQIADSLNVEGSNLSSSRAAKDHVDALAEGQFREVRQELVRQHQKAERIPHSVQFVLPPDWDIPFGNFGVAIRQLRDPDYAKCFTRVAKLMNDTTARIEARAQAEHEARLAEQKRQAEEAQKAAELANQRAIDKHQQDMELKARQAEQAKKLADAARKRADEEAALDNQRRQAEAERAQIAEEENARKRAEAGREAAKPENQLQRAYHFYGLVQYCNKVRQGYLLTYINDEEMGRARAMIKAIESKLVKQGFTDTSLTTDSIWKKAMNQTGGQPIDEWSCSGYYHQLSELSPVPSIQIQKP